MTKNTSKWGTDTAKERYGGGKTFSPPTDQSHPQSPEDKQGPDYSNDTPDNWLRGMGKGQAEGKPGFNKTRT